MKKAGQYFRCIFFFVFSYTVMLPACANQAGVEKAERLWKEYRPLKIRDFGSTQTLSILPLIDYHTMDENLVGEPGVSYLIQTDHHTILFDVGFNQKGTEPSPLECNMKRLGVALQDIDTIVISHNHPDHVGGFENMEKKTFSLGKTQADFTGKRVFTPTPMTYPGLEPACITEATVLGPGIATIGTIPRQLFLLGWTDEQALVVNVANKGVVIIVGCGHQTVPKFLKRVDDIFTEPVYGIIGGLHYPVPDGRIRKFGLDVQPMVSTESPFRGITMEDVQDNIEQIKAVKPAIVALSPHDSSDEALESFRQAFGPAYRELRVGDRIIIGL